MSKVSERYTAIVEKWLLGGLSLERMNLTQNRDSAHAYAMKPTRYGFRISRYVLPNCCAT